MDSAVFAMEAKMSLQVSYKLVLIGKIGTNNGNCQIKNIFFIDSEKSCEVHNLKQNLKNVLLTT